MSQAGDLGLDAETIIELPVETLAYGILRNYHESGSWSRHNWLMAVRSSLGRGAHMLALVEAWAWLEARGLMVPDPDQSSISARSVSRAGHRALERGALDEVVAAERLGLELHPRLKGKVRPIFLLGDYETAAFRAMKEVEVRVRELTGFSDSLVGVPLMRRAFSPSEGPLSDPALEAGEQDARSHLFAGAIGSFKNPTSHRPVTYEDPVEASEVVLLADLLMRVLDGIGR